jgi:hypothetical protein
MRVGSCYKEKCTPSGHLDNKYGYYLEGKMVKQGITRDLRVQTVTTGDLGIQTENSGLQGPWGSERNANENV